MPASLAGRTETLHVSLRSQSDADTFALGLKSFVNEARMLARFDHPSLLKVHRFWEANGTAYMAMPLYRGQTFKDVRLAMAPQVTGRAVEATDTQRARRVNEPALAASTAADVAPPAAKAAEAPAAPPALASPTERCGRRVLLALWLCIERECRKPELRPHAECVKWRADQEQMANPTR